MSTLVRVTVTLPREVLAAADARAAQLDRSRSWVVAEALRAYVTRAVVREPVSHPYESRPGLGEYRLQQLAADLALTPEQRVREAEKTAREIELVRGISPGRGVRFFDQYEDYLQWKRREGI
jgi:hypothetical protein